MSKPSRGPPGRSGHMPCKERLSSLEKERLQGDFIAVTSHLTEGVEMMKSDSSHMCSVEEQDATDTSWNMGNSDLI